MVVAFMVFVLFLSRLVPSFQAWMKFFGRNPRASLLAIELRAFSAAGENGAIREEEGIEDVRPVNGHGGAVDDEVEDVQLAVVVEVTELLRQRKGGVNARNACEEN